jgi:S-adenosyl-L-methionine hydrolase (adenosine-forming)
VFAPAAAHVALGVDLTRLGPPVADPVRLSSPEVSEISGALAGTVVHVDRFGNLVTSIHAARLEELGPGPRVRVGGRVLPLVGTYADLAPGSPGALVGSRHRLEIAVREGSAAALLKARRGTAVVVTRTSVLATTTKENS